MAQNGGYSYQCFCRIKTDTPTCEYHDEEAKLRKLKNDLRKIYKIQIKKVKNEQLIKLNDDHVEKIKKKYNNQVKRMEKTKKRYFKEIMKKLDEVSEKLGPDLQDHALRCEKECNLPDVGLCWQGESCRYEDNYNYLNNKK